MQSVSAKCPFYYKSVSLFSALKRLKQSLEGGDALVRVRTEEVTIERTPWFEGVSDMAKSDKRLLDSYLKNKETQRPKLVRKVGSIVQGWVTTTLAIFATVI